MTQEAKRVKLSGRSLNGASNNVQFTENSATKSIGYWDQDKTKIVRSTNTLIIHYNFADQEKPMNRSEADKRDVGNIMSTFKSLGHVCQTSDPKEKVLDLIGSENELRAKFQLEKGQTPELFIVFIMTHGNKNGKLTTHHDEEFNVYEVCEKLKTNPVLKNALKLLFVSACRGNILDEVTQEEHDTPIILIEDAVYSKKLDTEKPDNVNATRVTTDPNCENFVIMFSCVEGTYSLRSEGTYLVNSICDCFKELDKDVDLEEFLTRIMGYQHDPKQRAKGYTSTPEVKIMKRSRTLTIVKQCAEKKYNDFSYNWMSDAKSHLLTRKAHVFAASNEIYQSVSDELNKHFQFEPKRWKTLEELKDSVSHESGDFDGCVLICVVAELVENENREVCAKINGEKIELKSILGISIGPTTANWVGKPKICVFLNTNTVFQSCSIDIHQNYNETKLSISGTIHAGLLSIILPQANAVETFMETLNDFNSQKKIERATFQQFFFSLLQASETNGKIPPMIVTTLQKTLRMRFPPPIITECFTKTTDGNKKPCTISDLESFISINIKKLKLEFAGASSRGAEVEVDEKKSSILRQNATPFPTKAKKVSKTEEEISEEAVDTVHVVSADVGSGKSELAKYLTFFAQSTREATCVDLMTIMYQFGSRFNWEKQQNSLSAFVQECGEHIKQELHNGSNGVLIIDAIDSLLEDLRKNVLETVRELAENKVPMWIFTRPKCKDELLSHLYGICSVSVIEIDPLSKEKQTEFLQQWGFKRVQIDQFLDKIKQQEAEDLISKVGYLAKLSTFPDLAKNLETVNIYNLSAHIVDTAIRSYLNKQKPDLESSKRIEVFDKIKNELAHEACNYFLSTQIRKQNSIQQGKKALHDLFFRYPAVEVNGTLAAYLFVREMERDLDEKLETLKDDAKKASLERMVNFQREILTVF
ncbi:Hypothetical predicted protein [Cloeon dipterum]|uniref:Caspase family p20 domain-containing protein n=1 Tax=Cloeon dipterum TaxID=197152 RepID=A0A8S1D9J4_9INSE|nr:Hypothetical predicted protein [Cloeon dipterum]